MLDAVVARKHLSFKVLTQFDPASSQTRFTCFFYYAFKKDVGNLIPHVSPKIRLQNLNCWMMKFTVIPKKNLALGNLILSFKNLQDWKVNSLLSFSGGGLNLRELKAFILQKIQDWQKKFYYTVNNYMQVTGMVTGENFAFFIYRHFVEIL